MLISRRSKTLRAEPHRALSQGQHCVNEMTPNKDWPVGKIGYMDKVGYCYSKMFDKGGAGKTLLLSWHMNPKYPATTYGTGMA
jgi:hypothetical protein